jgi:DNA-binding SARP family transcriptional activator
MVARTQGRYDEAIESLRRLIQQDVRNHRLYLELADCSLKKGDKREAIEALEEFQRQGVRNNAVNEMLDKLKGH